MEELKWKGGSFDWRKTEHGWIHPTVLTHLCSWIHPFSLINNSVQVSLHNLKPAKWKMATRPYNASMPSFYTSPYQIPFPSTTVAPQCRTLTPPIPAPLPAYRCLPSDISSHAKTALHHSDYLMNMSSNTPSPLDPCWIPYSSSMATNGKWHIPHSILFCVSIYCACL